MKIGILALASMIGIMGCVSNSGRVIKCEANAASFQKALEKSRKVSKNKEIVIGEGVLQLDAPIVLDGHDTGLVLRGAGAGKTIISGGVQLVFAPVAGKEYWAAKMPEGAGEPGGLNIEGFGACDRAVYPHSGMLEYTDVSDLIWLGSQYGGWTRPPTEYELTHLNAKVADLPKFDPRDAEVEVPHSWDKSVVKVKDVDWQTGEITFADYLIYPAGGFGTTKYRIHNIEAGLLPGQWMYHYATREVFYRPKAGETPEKLKATAYVQNKILVIDGASNVTVSGLEMAYFNRENAISLKGCSDIAINNVYIHDGNGSGINSEKTPICNNITITNCRILDVKENGINLHVKGDSSVTGCEVSYIGNKGISVYAYATRATKHTTSHLAIENNRICDTGYIGILVAYPYDGKTPIDANDFDTSISHNKISKAMSNMLIQDGSAIYTFGVFNCRIDDNVIDDMPSTGKRHGIYFDEMSHDCSAKNNKLDVYSPVHLHKSKDVAFKNCVFTHDEQVNIALVTSDSVTLERCTIQAPEVIFSAPKDSLKRRNCIVKGKVTEDEKPRNFTLAFDNNNVLRCTMKPDEAKKERRLPKRIVCFGDSITAAGTFVGELQLYVSCRYPRERIEVYNAGSGGDSAESALKRLERDVLSLKPDMVMVCFGMNDVGTTLYKTRLPDSEENVKGRELGYTSYMANMKKITDTLSAKGIEVVVMAPFPYDEYGTRPGADNKLPFCNSVGLERLAAGCYMNYNKSYLFPMTRTVLSRLYAWYPELQITPDRIHPNKCGQWVVANEIAKTIFADIPAKNPIPFPMTQEMADFRTLPYPTAKILGEYKPIDTVNVLCENGEIGGQTAKLRQKLETLKEIDGRVSLLKYFDDILARKKIQPDDLAQADPVLDDFANRWGMGTPLQKYRQDRTQRAKITEERDAARDDYFNTLRRLAK